LRQRLQRIAHVFGLVAQGNHDRVERHRPGMGQYAEQLLVERAHARRRHTRGEDCIRSRSALRHRLSRSSSIP
jgi:hypothetical protein